MKIRRLQITHKQDIIWTSDGTCKLDETEYISFFRKFISFKNIILNNLYKNITGYNVVVDNLWMISYFRIK